MSGTGTPITLTEYKNVLVSIETTDNGRALVWRYNSCLSIIRRSRQSFIKNVMS